MSAFMDEKASIDHIEDGEILDKKDGHHHLTQQEMKHGDKALQYIGEERVEVTVEDVGCFFNFPNARRLTPPQDKRIRRLTDKYILSLLVWVYFLQILDKTVCSSCIKPKWLA